MNMALSMEADISILGKILTPEAARLTFALYYLSNETPTTGKLVPSPMPLLHSIAYMR